MYSQPDTHITYLYMLKVENYKCHWTFKLTREREHCERGEAELKADREEKCGKRGPENQEKTKKHFQSYLLKIADTQK